MRARKSRSVVRGALEGAREEVERLRRQAAALRVESRARAEREESRRGSAKNLATLFARTLTRNAELRAELGEAMCAAAPRLAESELELNESRDSVAGLMLQLSRERRHWKNVLLALRRKVLRARGTAAKRFDTLEVELSESQETAAKLLVELWGSSLR